MRLTALFVCLLTGAALAQPPPSQYALAVSATDSVVRLDGVLSESVWQRARVATDFIQNFPNDTARAYNQTEVRMAYDQNHFYLAVICYDRDRSKSFIASSLRRDFDWGANDNFTLYLDPFGDKTNGFTFNVTPLGVEREGLIFNGEEVASAWDNKWASKVRVYEDRWVAELMIPFTTVRYRGGTRAWHANFARHDLKNNQRSSWVPVPIAYRVSSLAFAGEVQFDVPLPHPGLNISLIPYLTARADQDYENGTPRALGGNAGFDAKVAVTPSLNLDLTVNPDFSQVEVDQQVTNLDRFEIFFPERRQFFLENNDLFSGFGFETLNPFFSRRIGIGRDTLTGLIRQNTLLYGARLSGKLDKNWRVGLLNTQTASNDRAGIPGQNYTVGTVQRQLFGRSNLAAILINRQQVGGATPTDPYTRLVGVDYNLQTADNRWQGKLFYHRAWQPGVTDGNAAQGSYLEYQSRNLNLVWNQEYVGENYRIEDVGYVPRNARNARRTTYGYWRFRPEASLTFYPKSSRWLVSHGPGAEANVFLERNFRLNDRELGFFYNLNLRNTSEASVGFYHYHNYLFFAVDPTFSGGQELPKGTGYTGRGVFWGYTSDARRRLSGSVEGFAGGYFNGRILNVVPRLAYRFQPYGAVSLAVEYNQIRLPEPYNSVAFWLISPRVDVSFSRSLFLTTFLQYNQQGNNVNLNARLQWRFKPVSDLFVVYSDNYFPGDFRVKTRALVIKLSYWFNV